MPADSGSWCDHGATIVLNSILDEKDVRLLDSLLADERYHLRFNKLAYYEPYKFQLEFHVKQGQNTPGVISVMPALIGANKVGKTYCAAMECAMHATGLYPDWWEGRRVFGPNVGTVVGTSNEQTRDVTQKELLGPPQLMPEEWGTGTIPLEHLGKPYRKSGVVNAIDSVLVRHHDPSGEPDGWSTIQFRTYEQAPSKLMGGHTAWAWLDEEPPQEIFSQIVRATLVSKAPILMTWTPEFGATELVIQFLTADTLPTGAACIQATWDDAPHFDDPAYKEAVLSRIPAHEREMRSKGVPLMGSGMVYPVPDEDIMIDPFEIPRHWTRLGAIDWGQDHAASYVQMAFDRDTGSAYVYSAAKEDRLTIHTFSSMIKMAQGPHRWVPIAWPHDVNVQDKTSSSTLRELFVAEGLNMLVRSFSNPPGAGQEEGQGGMGKEAGIIAMLGAMQLGEFKVFATCPGWFKEKRVYHRKDGKIVKRMDDIMDATRYCYQSRRHAVIEPFDTGRRTKRQSGLRNW